MAKKAVVQISDYSNLVNKFRDEQLATDLPPVVAGGPPPPPPDRKFKAKRINEHVKSVYALANTLAAAVIGTAFIVPSVTRERIPNAPDIPGWVLIGLCLHVFGHVVIRFGTRRED